eukprot:9862975-Karenia_brevis.AAC.1
MFTKCRASWLVPFACFSPLCVGTILITSQRLSTALSLGARLVPKRCLQLVSSELGLPTRNTKHSPLAAV